LLGYFCDSLKQRGTAIFWTRDRIAPKAPLYIDPLTMTGSLAAERAKKLGNELAVKHVLWPAYIRDQPEAEALWQAIQAAFAPPPKNHMIVVFGMPEALPVPPGMSRLPMPQFKCCDIADWLMDIATQRAWQETVVQRWIAFISMGETNGGPLPIDSVYDRLERCHKLLNRFPEDEEALLQELANQE
jgi:hypothetical protein